MADTKTYRLKPGFRHSHSVPIKGGKRSKLVILEAGDTAELTPEQAHAFRDRFVPVGKEKKAAPKPKKAEAPKDETPDIEPGADEGDEEPEADEGQDDAVVEGLNAQNKGQLEQKAKALGVYPETGTGKDGYVTKEDLVAAIAAAD
jgi:hypothetical protein